MKKTLALLLCVVLVLALAACGTTAPANNTPADTTADAPTDAPADNAAAAPAEPAPAEEEPADTAEAAGGDSLNIIFNCLFSETETGGQIASHFAETVEELSGGAITATVSYGGTYLGHGDQLTGMGNGSAQMCLLSQSDNPDELYLLNTIPQYFGDSIANAKDCFNDIVFENPTTSALIEAEAAANGIKYLTVSAGGSNAFISNFEVTGLRDMIEKSGSFGNHLVAMYQELGARMGVPGLNVIDVFPWDLAQDFQTGIIDATQMDASALVSMQLYADAPNWIYDNTYAAGNFITVNLDWWNGLTADQQATIQAAADDTEAFSLELLQSSIEADKATLAANGATVIDISAEDFDIWYDVIAQTAFRDGMTRGQNMNDVEGVQAIIDEVCALTGVSYNG